MKPLSANALALRAKLDAGRTLAAAARELGWTRGKARKIAARHGWSADPAAIARAISAGGIKGSASAALKLTREDIAARAKAQRDLAAEALRSKLAEGLSMTAAAASLRWCRKKARDIAAAYGLASSPEAVRAALSAGAIKRNTAHQPAAAEPAPTPTRAPPNPFLTAAQQANVDRQKKRTWQALRSLPPPSEEEAARAIADFLARRSITVCPPAARIDTTSNPLAPWRLGVGSGSNAGLLTDSGATRARVVR